ncbi:MAG: hypothetical protein VYC98_03260, partial [Planctomycetota bacterium]|nr:hypothetical protein [Planctomycetota bacterium]
KLNRGLTLYRDRLKPMRMAGKHPLGWFFAVDPPESRKLDSIHELGKLRRFPATSPSAFVGVHPSPATE